jgi:acyl-CoA thioesterase
MEMRAANLRQPETLDGTPGTGRSALWVRNPWGSDAQAAALAIVGDFVPLGISQAAGRLFEGNSLDNTLRMVRVHPTEWILADIRVHGLAEGFGHGLVHLWAEDGTLLASASQSAIVRNPRKASEKS